jgi:ribosomal subunit interface protein
MDIQVSGRQFDVGEALTDHVKDRLAEGVQKYFEKAVESTVTFSREGHLVRTDCSVHAGHSIVMQSHGSAEDPYASFDQSLARIEKRLRRYKSRLVDHHRADKEALVSRMADSYVIAGEDADSEKEPEELQPVIVAETKTDIPTVTVGGAVMRMDLSASPVFVFHNSAHGGLNVVYRRADGNIGWIDPKEAE